MAQLPGCGRTIYATYEVLNCDANSIHEAVIGVYLAFVANTSQNLPELGLTTVRTGIAPVSGITVSESGPINLFKITPCSSGLLFPFVTNRDGLDTRIVVANTSLDPFGTPAQQGPVKLYFYDDKTADGCTPQLITTQPIRAGQQLVFSLANGGNFGMPPVPGFQGYIFAITEFQYSHALALIGDPGGEGLTQSYLAVRVPSNGYPTP